MTLPKRARYRRQRSWCEGARLHAAYTGATLPIPENTILVGEEITPAMLGVIPTERLGGVVSLGGSGNSHVAILARAMGVPAVMGALDLPAYELEGAEVIVDGHYGDVYTRPSPARLTENRLLLQQEQVFAEELNDLKELPGVTRDGWQVQLWVNIG